MDFSLLIAMIATFVAAQYAETKPVDAVWIRGAMVVAVVLLPALIAMTIGVVSRWGWSTGEAPGRAGVVRRMTWGHAAVRMIWLAGVVAIMLLVGWPRIVLDNAHLRDMLLLKEIVLLTPVLGSWWLAAVCMMHTRHSLEATLDDAPNAGLWRQASTDATTLLRLQAGVYVAPVLLVLPLHEGFSRLAGGDPKGWTALLPIAAIFLVAIGFPLILRWVWRCRPLPEGPLRERLERCAADAGLQVRDILIWETGGLIRNAAMAGFGGRLRYVFLSDGLLRTLAPDEVEAIYRHELGHVRHAHLIWRMLIMLLPVSLYLAWAVAAPGRAAALEGWFEHVGPATTLATAGGIAVFFLLYLRTVFMLHARRLEFQADLETLRPSLGETLDAAIAQERVETYAGALAKLRGASDRSSPEGQHPAEADRLDRLHLAAVDPSVGDRLTKSLRLTHAIFLAIAGSPLLVIAVRETLRFWGE